MKDKIITNSTRDCGIDWIKTIGIIFVIFTHCNWTTDERSVWLFPFWVELAVPLFMVVTGYNNYYSLKNRESKEWRKKSSLRILIPFAFVMVLEGILLLIKNYSLKDIFLILITGGIGPGSYYTVVLIQIIIIYPVLFRLINTKYGMVIIFLSNLIFEIIVSVTDMSPTLYRLLSFRYLSFLAVGSEYARFKKFITEKQEMILGLGTMIIGLMCIYTLSYSGIELIIFKQWTVTSMPIVFMAFSMFILWRRFLTYRNGLIETISKSSFHIFLTQMVYYHTLENVLYKLIPISNEFIAFLINACICISCGVLFFYAEKSIIKFVRTRIN